MNQSHFYNAVESIKNKILHKYLFGEKSYLELILIGYFCRGHILVEGPPGTAKTMVAKLLAGTIAKTFKRIQFTTDLLPSDILGANIYLPDQQRFEFIQGPVFSDFVLADEINRAPPRTQSGLLEAMEERQVTIEGKTYNLSPDFFVIATENPQDYEGTFPLPEVQMDRFLFKILVNHGTPDLEMKVLQAISEGVLPPSFKDLEAVEYNRKLIDQEIESVRFDQTLFKYISDLIASTRNHPMLVSGSSVRGGIALTKASKIKALLAQRDYVIPDDIKDLALPTLRHRIRLGTEAQISGINPDHIIREVIDKIEFPA